MIPSETCRKGCCLTVVLRRLADAGKQPTLQHPLKARGDVKAAEDSQVASNTGLARLIVIETILACVQPLFPGTFELNHVVGLHVRRNSL